MNVEIRTDTGKTIACSSFEEAKYLAQVMCLGEVLQAEIFINGNLANRYRNAKQPPPPPPPPKRPLLVRIAGRLKRMLTS